MRLKSSLTPIFFGPPLLSPSLMSLHQKITDVFNESRILVLGIQIIIGFQWRAIFESGYEQLPRPA